MRISSQRRRSTSTGPRRQPAMPSASVCDDRVSARAGQVRFTDERTCATSAAPQFAEGLIVGGSVAATGVIAELPGERSPVDVPLLNLPDSHQALDSKGALVYERDGLHLEVDFGKETWAAYSAGNRPFPEPGVSGPAGRNRALTSRRTLKTNAAPARGTIPAAVAIPRTTA